MQSSLLEIFQVQFWSEGLGISVLILEQQLEISVWFWYKYKVCVFNLESSYFILRAWCFWLFVIWKRKILTLIWEHVTHLEKKGRFWIFLILTMD